MSPEVVRQVRGPKQWCKPPSAFGKLGVEQRTWRRPGGQDPVALAAFRAAVMQNAIAVSVREFKNGVALRRTGLAALDGRLNSLELWDARLNGHENLTTSDIATLMTVLPDALPDTSFVANFLAVAEGGRDSAPRDWPYPDSAQSV